ncbi:MAG: endonuclease/exonuclease/phosphatase family protein [Rhizobiaceae bacterium]|nr:endonuclease/exonuclease/phosphatase family protein [Rhizobiaceae bacterium]
MRILSLNAWGGKLHAPLIDYLPAVQADVLCLQEVVNTPGCSEAELIYRDGDHVLNQRANLYEDIKRVLPQHEPRFFPAARGVLHDGEGRTHASEFGLATFIRRDLSAIGEAMGFVHGTFFADGWGDHPRARNAHCVRLFDPTCKTPIAIAHMHGLRDPATGKADSDIRRRQAERLAALIGTVWQPGERLVVCGDFNVLPGSSIFDVLAALGLNDLVVGRAFSDTRTSHYAKPERFADYMLVNEHVEVVSFDVVEHPEISDHRALVLELR